MALAAGGLVAHCAGAFGGWRLTSAGREADAAWIAAELDRARARPEVQEAYEDFLPLNQRTLDTCAAWQVRSGGQPMVLNDHTDKRYDAGVLSRLAAADAEAQGVCARLAGRLNRFSQYGLALRPRWTGPDGVSSTSSPTASTPTTPSGSSFTRTCLSPSASGGEA